MFKLNLKIALRNLIKNKGYTFINIAGLSIGMAGCILIYMFIHYQLSFDSSFAKKDRIYRVITSFDYSGTKDYSQGVPIPLTSTLKTEFPQIEQAAALQLSGGILKVRDQSGKEIIKTAEDLSYAGPEFFEIFDAVWITGNPVNSLSQPNSVVLSKKMAEKYFGNWKSAVGKTINLQNKTDLRVTGILNDFPENSSFPLNIIVSYATYFNRENKNWESIRSNSNCYLLVKEGTDITAMQKSLTLFSEKKYRDKDMVGKVEHLLQPLGQLHYDERVENPAHQTVPMKSIIALGIIGLFLILTACINFINMATAQMAARSREVGVRKVMGSSRRQLTLQFLLDTSVVTFIALLCACVYVELVSSALPDLLQSDMKFGFAEYPSTWLFAGSLLVLVSFLAGLYPAFVMARYSPALAIKNQNPRIGGGLNLRKTLMVVQFLITGALVTGTLVVVRQMKYVREKPLGFSSTATAIVDIPSDSLSRMKFERLKEKLATVPGVKNLSFCSAAPTSFNNYGTDFIYNNGKKSNFSISAKSADEDYFKTFDMKIMAGRTFYKSDTVKEYVVNETLLKKLGINNVNEVLGKPITVGGRKGTIVGVVHDFMDQSLHETISPIAISPSKDEYFAVAVKLDTKSISSAMKEVAKKWEEVFPDHVYGSVFLDEEINRYYKAEQITGTLFKLFAGIIIFISFIGLFGLISFISAQRTKEIAIRKILGASTLGLISMLNHTFLKMVLLANLLSWPIAYIFIQQWLAGFAYRIELSVWPFILAMAASFLLTLLIVSLRSYRAAKSNPVTALKYE